MVGVFILSARLLLGCIHLRRLRRQTRPAPDAWQHVLERLRRELAVARPILLLESVLVGVPMTLGHLRPLILLPASALTGLSTAHLEALLAHELAHIRRYDYLANLVQSVVETLLFYHPALWWLSAQVRQERENCCDDMAAKVCGDPLLYARALTAMEALRKDLDARVQWSVRYTPALGARGAAGSSLLPRIRRVLGLPALPTRRWIPATSALAAIIVVALLLYVAACKRSEPVATPTTGAAAMTRPAAGSATPLIVRVYDIRDLLVLPDSNINAPEFDLNKITTPTGTFKSPEIVAPAERRAAAIQQISTVIQQTVDPVSWRNASGGSIREFNGQFIINQTAQNQAVIKALLDQLRDDRALQISVEARFMAIDEATYKSLSLPGTDVNGVVLSDQQLESVLRAVKDSPTASTVDTPRVTLFSGQEGYVAVTNQQNFIASYSPATQPSGHTELQPQVSTLTTGITFYMQVTASADRRCVVAKLRPQLSALNGIDRRPLPDLHAKVATGASSAFIDLPRISYTAVNTMVSIPDGRTILMGGQVITNELEAASAATSSATRPTMRRILLILVRPKILLKSLPAPAATTPQS